MKKARETIINEMEELGEITKESVKNLIRPHFSPDILSLKEQALGRAANNLMAYYKDEKGIRLCFSCKNENGDSKYVNIDTTLDLKSIVKIEDQLKIKHKGLNKSRKKVRKRKLVLSGQISIFDN